MFVEVWSLPGCPRCESARERLRAAGVDAQVRDLGAVKRAEIRDVDLLTQITLQDGFAPVLRVVRGAGRTPSPEFVEPDDLPAWLEANAPTAP